MHSECKRMCLCRAKCDARVIKWLRMSMYVCVAAFGTRQTHTLTFSITLSLSHRIWHNTNTYVCIHTRTHTHTCVCIANALAQVRALSGSNTPVLPAFTNSYEDHPVLAMEFVSAKNNATQPPTEAASLPRLTFPVLGEGWEEGVGDA